MAEPDELLQQLCRDLRQLRAEAGGPSMRMLAGRVGLGKTQVGAILNGKIRRPPDWDVIRNVIDSVRAYADDHGRRAGLSLRTGVIEYWRPRYAMLEHAFRQAPREVLAAGLPAAVATARRTVPRQLPAAVMNFAGRSADLAGLTELLRRSADNAGTVVISAIGGTAGIGKTTLAVHWAHRVRQRFPDGQLYVNLRGFDPTGSAQEPAAVIRGFLEALGVPPQRLPVDLDALTALYRSEVAGRRMLIVLDNARDSAQVCPLLPGAPGCLVLVTSRTQLGGLVTTHAAHTVTLDLLSAAEARELLAHRLGADRVAAEPDAVDEIAGACALLPLALSIVAARAANHPHLPLRALASELSDADGRLDALTTDDPGTDVRTVISWSYRALPADTGRLFRLLGLHPGPDFTAAAAASLAALDLPRARALLEELTRANLITQNAPGRYTFHDLLRAYAAEQAHAVETDQQRHAAIRRTLDHYLHTACRAARLLDSTYAGLDSLAPLGAGVTPETPADPDGALSWFAAEHAVLMAAVDQATASGLDLHTWQLAWAMTDFVFRRGYWDHDIVIQRAAIAATERLGIPIAQARSHVNLANAYTRMGRLDDAHAHYRQGLELATLAGTVAGQGIIHHNLAALCLTQESHAEALDHARRAVNLFEVAGFRLGVSRSLSSVGAAYAGLGEHQSALKSCRQASPSNMSSTTG